MPRAAETFAIRSAMTFLRRTAEGTVDGSAVACDGRWFATAICALGSVGSGCTGQFRLQQSDDGSSWTTLVEAPAVGELAAPKMQILEARPTRKYVRVQHDVVGTAGVIGGAVLLLGDGPLPESNSDVYSV